MTKDFNNIPWKEILEKFSSYEGTVSGFCKESNISKSQFYYYKKRLAQLNKPTFHAIALKSEETAALKIAEDNLKICTDIRIEIGRANIYIPANETALLATILKELAKSC